MFVPGEGVSEEGHWGHGILEGPFPLEGWAWARRGISLCDRGDLTECAVGELSGS